jgi:hypothetical protein
VLAANEREALLHVADQLCALMGHPEGGEIPEAVGGRRGDGALAGILGPEDELLIAAMRRRLTTIAAAALDGGEPEGAVWNAVASALDAAEMVMRGEIVMGNAGRLPALLPDLIFLVTLPIVDHAEALELSERCARMVEQAF